MRPYWLHPVVSKAKMVFTGGMSCCVRPCSDRLTLKLPFSFSSCFFLFFFFFLSFSSFCFLTFSSLCFLFLSSSSSEELSSEYSRFLFRKKAMKLLIPVDDGGFVSGWRWQGLLFTESAARL